MKTLDEVINELHYWDTCDEYPEFFYDFEVTRDALHYLKAYRDDKDDLTALRAYWAEMHKDVRQKAEVTDESDC